MEDFFAIRVNVPYTMAARCLSEPFRVRMDFRDPNIVGTFVYHCHLPPLEHEDKGIDGLDSVDLPITCRAGK